MTGEVGCRAAAYSGMLVRVAMPEGADSYGPDAPSHWRRRGSRKSEPGLAADDGPTGYEERERGTV